MRTFRPRPCSAERNHVAGTWSGGTWSGGYYAPWLGRWVSADPIGLGDGTNVYAYVGGNPVTYVDPGGDAGTQGPDRCDQPRHQ
jgi:hypothetical protein